jgi:hypothetical protein
MQAQIYLTQFERASRDQQEAMLTDLIDRLKDHSAVIAQLS